MYGLSEANSRVSPGWTVGEKSAQLTGCALEEVGCAGHHEPGMISLTPDSLVGPQSLSPCHTRVRRYLDAQMRN